MTNLEIYIQMLIKMKWFLLPLTLLIVLWGLYEQIEKKWDAR